MRAQEPSGFVQRLEEICPDLGVPNGRGRHAQLGKRLGVSTNAARKWLLGEGLPELDRVIQIAKLARVNVPWLLQGVGPKRVVDAPPAPPEQALAHALQVLPPDATREVLDFVRYKLSKVDDSPKCQLVLRELDAAYKVS